MAGGLTGRHPRYTTHAANRRRTVAILLRLDAAPTPVLRFRALMVRDPALHPCCPDLPSRSRMSLTNQQRVPVEAPATAIPARRVRKRRRRQRLEWRLPTREQWRWGLLVAL